MAVSGVAVTVTYGAYDTSANAWKTGDVANHTLRINVDGAEATPAASPTEVDATNAPGLYEVVIAAGENTGTDCTLHGKSATANIIIVPTRWQNTAVAVSTPPTASANAAAILAATVDFAGATDKTVTQILQAAWGQAAGKWAISGTTLTIYEPDGSTAIATFTLDDADSPTSRTPA